MDPLESFVETQARKIEVAVRRRPGRLKPASMSPTPGWKIIKEDTVIATQHVFGPGDIKVGSLIERRGPLGENRQKLDHAAQDGKAHGKISIEDRPKELADGCKFQE